MHCPPVTTAASSIYGLSQRRSGLVIFLLRQDLSPSLPPGIDKKSIGTSAWRTYVAVQRWNPR